MYVCTYVHTYTYTHTHAHTRAHTCIHTCIPTYIHVPTCIHTYTHMHTHMYTRIHTVHNGNVRTFIAIQLKCLLMYVLTACLGYKSRPSLVGENTVGGKSTTCMGYNTLHYLQYITYMQLFNNHLRMRTAETSIFKWGPKVSYPTSLQKDEVQTKSFLPYPWP